MNKFRKTFDHKYWLYDFTKLTGCLATGLFFRPKKVYIDKSNKSLRGRLIICANHTSYQDVVFLFTAIWQRRISFLATKDLFEKKFKGFFKNIGCIKVDKDNFDIDTIKQTVNVIDRGHAVCIFPEGQIHRDEDNHPFKSGIVMTAYLAKADILPIYIPKRKSNWNRSVMIIGKRIKIKDLFKSQFPTIDEIESVTNQLNQKVLELKQYYINNIVRKKDK